MFLPFQSASHIDDYLPAIAGLDEFIVKRDVLTGISVINYNYVTESTFPDPATLTGDAQRLAILRRDCRGIKFDLETGDVVTKPYHKFFGINEKAETQAGTLDWTQPHHVLEKLDGSMVTGYRHRDGSWQWHTKMGATPVAEPVGQFVAASEYGYVALVEALYGVATPIFEWCSRQQRIVVDYPQEQLVLTAVRDLHTGTYASYDQMQAYAVRYNVPVVAAFGNIDDIQQFLRKTGDLEGTEGYVIRFADGHAVKCKGDWYRRIHTTKELITLEKNVWNLLLCNGLDDAKPFMQDGDRQMIEAFATEFYRRLQVTTDRLVAKVTFDRRLYADKRQFAKEGVMLAHPQERAILFRIWDGHDGWTEVSNYLAKNIGTQTRLDAVRSFVGGLCWKQFYITSLQ